MNDLEIVRMTRLALITRKTSSDRNALLRCAGKSLTVEAAEWATPRKRLFAG
jgi:hypothetical protein